MDRFDETKLLIIDASLEKIEDELKIIRKTIQDILQKQGG